MEIDREGEGERPRVTDTAYVRPASSARGTCKELIRCKDQFQFGPPGQQGAHSGDGPAACNGGLRSRRRGCTLHTSRPRGEDGAPETRSPPLSLSRLRGNHNVLGGSEGQQRPGRGFSAAIDSARARRRVGLISAGSFWGLRAVLCVVSQGVAACHWD